MTPADLGDFSATFTTLPGKDALELTGIAESYPQPFGDGSFDFDTILPNSEDPKGVWLLTFFPSDSAEKPGGLGNHVEDVGVPYVYSVSNSPNLPTAPTGGVPEPASWALMIAGFGLAGAGLRRRRGRAETVT
ncbi:MAG: PEP-CTERM sorting domain-containing protein [Phenylobacterium sp.]|nr:MAG: PEP-CTERM sorting domain-containing protein [Phenylobacterium sp.]